MEEKRSSMVPLVVAVLLLLPSLYVGGYFLLSKRVTADGASVPTVVRFFNNAWIAAAYKPMLMAEMRITGERVIAAYPDEALGARLVPAFD